MPTTLEGPPGLTWQLSDLKRLDQGLQGNMASGHQYFNVIIKQ